MTETGQPEHKLRILVVDDEEDVRKMISTLLEKLGHEPIPFDKARDVLSAVSRGKADLMLLDLNMPGAGGLELLKVLRRRRFMIPTIIVSAHVSAEIAQQLAVLGISGIVAKPFKRDRLESEIRKAVG